MKYYDGVGLSANQIGYKYSVFSMNHEGNNMVLFNPQIIEESEEYVWEVEGCLTYPGLYIKISRPRSLSASWEDAENKNFSGYFSSIRDHPFAARACTTVRLYSCESYISVRLISAQIFFLFFFSVFPLFPLGALSSYELFFYITLFL